MQGDEQPEFREHPIVWDERKVARLWDYYSRTPGFRETYFSRIHGSRILRQSKLDLRKPLRVLDFGCGPGYMWDHLRDDGSSWQYTGLDFSAQSVQKLQERAEGSPTFVAAHHVTSLPSDLADGTFDALMLIEVIEHLTQDYLDLTLREVFRLLTPGGAVIVTVPNDENLADCTKFCAECGAIFHEWQHLRSWTPASLQREFETHGFSLKFTKVLDLGAVGLLGQAVRMARKWLLGKNAYPHLMAVFERRRA